jgi:8-oxo-dGTP pyrophosphatase MutT (NUDIX family)
MNYILRCAYLLKCLHWRIARPVKVGVRLMLIQDGRVLMVRHTYLPGWYFVGGGVEKGETLEEAARREAHEEVGAQLGELGLVGVYTHFIEGKSDHIAVFVCEDFTLSGKKDFEIEEVRFFDLVHLPEELAPGQERRIQEYLAGNPTPRFGRW